MQFEDHMYEFVCSPLLCTYSPVPLIVMDVLRVARAVCLLLCSIPSDCPYLVDYSQFRAMESNCARCRPPRL